MPPSIAIGDLLNPKQPSIAIPISRLLNPAPHSPATQPESFNANIDRSLIHKYYELNRKTTLSSVYCYSVDTILEYPETGVGPKDLVGHLFEMRTDAWLSPSCDFAYSRGIPSGKTSYTVTIPLLVDSITGEPVPCLTRYATCRCIYRASI